MTTNLLAIAALFGIALLWEYAGHVGRLRLAGAVEDARVSAGPALLAGAGDRDTRCPRCHGRHCQPWRTAGADCGPQRAPRLTETLAGVGLHQPAVMLRRIVPGGWLPPRAAWSTLRERIGTLPAVGVLP